MPQHVDRRYDLQIRGDGSRGRTEHGPFNGACAPTCCCTALLYCPVCMTLVEQSIQWLPELVRYMRSAMSSCTHSDNHCVRWLPVTLLVHAVSEFLWMLTLPHRFISHGAIASVLYFTHCTTWRLGTAGTTLPSLSCFTRVCQRSSGRLAAPCQALHTYCAYSQALHTYSTYSQEVHTYSQALHTYSTYSQEVHTYSQEVHTYSTHSQALHIV